MKKIALYLGIGCAMNIHFSSVCMESKKKIIVHFDVNKTMIAEDPAGEKTVEGILNAEFAEQTMYHWHGALEEPISYANYIKDHVVKGKKDDRAIKKKRYEKTSTFLKYLEQNSHPLYSDISKKYEALHAILKNHTELDTNKQRIIFPSCYKIIKKLRDANQPHVIVLRTFGKDLGRVMAEINRAFPDFFAWRGTFKDNSLTLESLHSREKHTLHTAEEFYKFLKNKEGHFAVQDDWDTWHKNGETSQFGKLFPIDPQDDSVVTVFPDDNGDEGIINPRNIHTEEPIEVQKLIDDGIILVANMLRAIENEDYYVDHLEKLIGRKK